MNVEDFDQQVSSETLRIAVSISDLDETPVQPPALSMHIDWNDVNNIDPGSNREIDGKVYTTDTIIRISGLTDNPEIQVAVGVVNANNYTSGHDSECGAY